MPGADREFLTILATVGLALPVAISVRLAARHVRLLAVAFAVEGLAWWMHTIAETLVVTFASAEPSISLSEPAWIVIRPIVGFVAVGLITTLIAFPPIAVSVLLSDPDGRYAWLLRLRWLRYLLWSAALAGLIGSMFILGWLLVVSVGYVLLIAVAPIAISLIAAPGRQRSPVGWLHYPLWAAAGTLWLVLMLGLGAGLVLDVLGICLPNDDPPSASKECIPWSSLGREDASPLSTRGPRHRPRDPAVHAGPERASEREASR